MHGTKLALEIYLIGLVGTARKSIVICAHVSADYRLCYLVPVAWMFWVNHEKIFAVGLFFVLAPKHLLFLKYFNDPGYYVTIQSIINPLTLLMLVFMLALSCFVHHRKKTT